MALFFKGHFYVCRQSLLVRLITATALQCMRAANPCWPQAAVMAGAQMVAGCQRWGSNSSTRLALCVGSLVSTSLR